MKLALSIIAGFVLAVATVTASKSISGYCGQQWPRLFASSLCGHLSSIGGPVVGRGNGAFVRGSARSMQTNGLASPTWTTLTTDQPGSWQHSDGHTYTVVEGVQFERQQNNWWTDADAIDGCSLATCVREASALGPGGFAMRINFSGAGTTQLLSDSTGIAEGDPYTACVYAWVESGTLPVRIQGRIGGGGGNQTANNDATLTTVPTEYCARMIHDGSAVTEHVYARLIEDPAGDGTGVDILVGYMSGIVGGVTSTPIENNNPITPETVHVQREADVLPFSTKDLGVESGEGEVYVAALDYAYDWPATPAVHTVVSLAKPGEVRDDTGGTLYTGTIQSAPVFDDGGLDMDGVDDFVTTPDVAALDTGTGDFGAEAWFRVDTDKTFNVVMGKALHTGNTPGWWFGRINTATMRFTVYGTLTTKRNVDIASGAYTDGNWHHVMVVRDRTGDGNLHLYLDGTEPVAAVADGGATEDLDNSAAFRAGKVETVAHFEGAIKKVIYYVGTAKTLADALAAYNAGHASRATVPSDATLAWSMVPTDCRVYYDRPDASTNRFAYTCGGPTAWQTTTFERGAVSELTWRRKAGTPLELCVDGICVNSAETYIAPSTLDTNGCWGCDDPGGSPTNFLDGGMREARLR